MSRAADIAEAFGVSEGDVSCERRLPPSSTPEELVADAVDDPLPSAGDLGEDAYVNGQAAGLYGAPSDRGYNRVVTLTEDDYGPCPSPPFGRGGWWWRDVARKVTAFVSETPLGRGEETCPCGCGFGRTECYACRLPAAATRSAIVGGHRVRDLCFGGPVGASVADGGCYDRRLTRTAALEAEDGSSAEGSSSSNLLHRGPYGPRR